MAGIPEGGFTKADELERWLDSLPEDRRLRFARVLALRSALRVVPLAGLSWEAGLRDETVAPRLTMAVFRANAISRAACTWPAREIDAAAFWSAVTNDARALDTGRDVLAAPLWPDEAPDWVAARWAAMRKALPARPDDHWSVWLDWCQSMLDGRPAWNLPPELDEEVSVRIALGDNRPDFWDRKPGAINAEIAGWVAEAKRRAELAVAAEAPPAWDFFISYSTKDEAMARRIGGILEDAGHTVFAQYKDFGPGFNFVREMQRGLANAGRMIALHSPDYEASDHCQNEWSAAYASDPGSEKASCCPS